MPIYINTKVMYGHKGPYKAISKEALADELNDMFLYWTHQILDPIMQYVIDGSKMIDEHVEQLRQSFINGLIEIEAEKWNYGNINI